MRNCRAPPPFSGHETKLSDEHPGTGRKAINSWETSDSLTHKLCLDRQDIVLIFNPDTSRLFFAATATVLELLQISP